MTSDVSATAHLSLRLEVDADSIATVTFNQSNSRANTLNQAILTELESVAFVLSKRTNLKGLIFRSGKPGILRFAFQIPDVTLTLSRLAENKCARDVRLVTFDAASPVHQDHVARL